MSEYNFLEDIEEGIKASDQAEQNVNEITGLITALEGSIKTKYNLELKKRNAVDLNNIINSFNSFNSLSKTTNPETIFSLSSDSSSLDIMSIKLEDKGYPVKLSYDGQNYFCENLTALQRAISNLLKTAYFGKKIKKLTSD
ncbi:hypothetical protein [Acinetobacter pittii]|uniref:hypothetical protein n=1 Tax=Acinetobacter pittii TaxID=48296 RepID=UPI00192B3C98|nr:hypothetical protein [Acinetobacter pittii]